MVFGFLNGEPEWRRDRYKSNGVPLFNNLINRILQISILLYPSIEHSKMNSGVVQNGTVAETPLPKVIPLFSFSYLE
jgi:hypothetical protein